MLTVNVHKRSCQVLIGMLLCGLPAVASAEESRRSATQAREERGQSPSRQPFGAPQVLEIPPIQETAPIPPDPSVETVATPPRDGPPELYDYSGSAGSDQAEMARRRTYFGVLYATAEEGERGVKVLDVIPGSPAQRAGFEGVNAPPSQSNDLVKLGLIALMMSPVGPFAMPLVIAHDMYRASQAPGDLIVAVGDQQVHDSLEFSQEMRRYQPGDTVTFSVLRSGKSLQIPVQLEEEPS